MKKTLITGAAGFIGSNVAGYFCEKGVNPVCYVKKTSDLKFIKNLPVKIIYGDILDLENLKNSMKNVDTVIHIAALSKDWGSYSDFYNINVKGTLNVLKAGTEMRVKHFIITGTISSYGEENSSQIKNENYPFNSHYPYFMDRLFPCKMNYYRDTKALSTKQAVEYANSKNINLTVIEPVWVYGEHEFNTGFYEYMKTAKTGIPFFPGSKKNKFHVVYVRDLAEAYYQVFLKRLPGINRFIIGNRKRVYMNRIFELFCSEMGVRKPWNLPKSVVYPIAFIMELVYTILAGKYPPLLTRGRVNMFYDNIEYSTKKAQQKLLFVNKYSIEEGIKKTVQWYKQNQLI